MKLKDGQNMVQVNNGVFAYNICLYTIYYIFVYKFNKVKHLKVFYQYLILNESSYFK